MRTRCRGHGALKRLLAPILFCACLPAAVSAEVVAASPGSFSTRDATELLSVPIAIQLAVERGIGAWWDPAYTVSGDASALTLELEPGGCLCEARAGAEPFRHMTVVEVERGRMFKLSGALGPLAGTNATGILTWTVTERAGRSRIEVTYEVSGDPSLRLDTLASEVDLLLTEQLQRLKRFIESGRP
ncbi:MAG: hypothetical protein AB7F99_03590 [Vicinamibacterales bacterium]